MNYIGSKSSLLTFLERHIVELANPQPGWTLFDVFAGTGAVGRHFKQRGLRVVANDIQYYSYCLNRALVGINEPPTFAGIVPELPAPAERLWSDPIETVLTYLNQLPGTEGFIYEQYCLGGTRGTPFPRQYFTDENGKRCDAIRQQIELWYQAGRIAEDEYFYLLASLLEAIDQVANTASVYGAFLKRFKPSARKPLRLERLGIVPSRERHLVCNCEGVALVAQVPCDILYVDPPYNQRQYCTNYHVLETIARYDRPQLSGVTGLRAYEHQKSGFCSRMHARQALEQLLRRTTARYVFVSYNSEGLLTASEIVALMEGYGRVVVREEAYRRFRADVDRVNRRYKADTVTEYLFCLWKQA